LTLPRSVTSGKGRDAIINEYYDETQLLTVIETWIKQLIQQEELPYNPYPGLVWQARRCAERYRQQNSFLSVTNSEDNLNLRPKMYQLEGEILIFASLQLQCVMMHNVFLIGQSPLELFRFNVNKQ